MPIRPWRIGCWGLIAIFALGAAALTLAEEEADNRPNEKHAATTVKADPRQDEAVKPLDIQAVLTFGKGGCKRSSKIIAGDSVYFFLKISGVKSAPIKGGILDLEISVDSANGAPIYKRKIEYAAEHAFGEGIESFPYFAEEITKFTPGKYVAKISVVERKHGGEAETKVPFEILPADTFGVMNVGFFGDEEHTVPIGANVSLGQFFYCYQRVTGWKVVNGRICGRSESSIIDCRTQKRVELSSTILDQDVDDKEKNAWAGAVLPLTATASGRFIIEARYIDRNANATKIVRLPLNVIGETEREEAKR